MFNHLMRRVKQWSRSLYQVVSAESVLAWLGRADKMVGQSVLTLP
jgi:hypothetical protein